MPAARALRRTVGTARHPRFPLIRRSATAPLCGFGRTAPPPGGHAGSTREDADARAGRRRDRRGGGHGRFNRYGGVAAPPMALSAGTADAARAGPGCLDSSDARLAQTSTLVLVRQWGRNRWTRATPRNGQADGRCKSNRRRVCEKARGIASGLLGVSRNGRSLRIDRDLAIQGDNRVGGVEIVDR